MTTTNFNEWLTECSLEDSDEVHSIYHAVLDNDGSNWGGYYVKNKGVQTFVYSDSHDTVLLLASENARTAFLDFLDSHYECGVDGQREFDRAMARED